jgi:hypothetical protein
MVMDARGKEIEEAIALLCKSLREMMGEMESGAYTPRPLPLTMLKNMTRETYQDLYRRQALEVIRKLKLNQPIDQEEARLVEEWMVGDLEIYQVMEGHYREWREEVLQHCDGLASIGRAGLEDDAQSLLRIRASLMELEHVLGDIDHYRYALDRLERFRSYVGQDINALDHQEKAKLADHMNSMVYSDRY